MKKERKFTWCVRYYKLKTSDVEYRMYFDLTTSEIRELVGNFVASHKGYLIRIFKNYETL